MINLSLQRHALFALLAAALFGASPALAKLLVGELSPMVLAGLLYLGSGLGLSVVWLARALYAGARPAPGGETHLQRADYPWLAGAIVSGGVLAPVLLLGEPLTVMLLVAVALMAVASWLVLTERHAHAHGHELLRHVHEHVHDEHHQHIHGEEAGDGPHAHAHSHAPLQHSHAHLPDIHHRHGH